MIASDIISHDVLPLRTSDTGDTALGIMADYFIQHLPIVNNKQLLGLIAEPDILDHDPHEPIGSYQLSLTRPFVKDSDHLYEVLRVLHEFKLTVVPVIDHEENYLGVITQADLLRFFAQTGSFTEPGSILVLELSRRDYSLSEISRIVESESAAILSSYVTSPMTTGDDMIDVTLKINRQEISRIIASFERFDYRVKASFQETEFFESLKDRYDSLLNYLNV